MYLGGSPDNVVEFYKIKKKLKCYLIEDACHALGASYKYKNKSYEIGSCKHSDICTFSLHPLKSITSGEGGIVCTNNSLLAKNIKKIRSHGIQKNKKDGHWVYDVSEPGYNFRISEMNCALALSQLDKLDSFINLRKKISTQYINFFKSFEHLLKVRPCNSMDQNAWHLFVILVDFKKFKISKNDFFKHLLKKGIICQQHYMPLYEFSYYSHINRKNFINSSVYINSAISIPIYFELKKSKIKYICQIIKNFLTQNIIKDGI
jgi:dTDP-4-amino-4,6-dideoxygalactose transaminase